MKKLIFVTLLAVAASWLLSQAEPTGPAPEPATTTKTVFVRDAPRTFVAPSAEEAETIRTIPWRKGGGGRAKRSTTVSPSPEAKAAPSWFPKSEGEEQAKAQADDSGSRVLVGRVSASEDRARRDLRLVVERQVADWLSADVPPSWKVPAKAIDAMARGSYVQQVTRNLTATDPSAANPPTSEAAGLDGLYTLYRAGQKLDFSTTRRAKIVGMYRHELASRRLHRFGGGMALALVGLAVLSGYIKADEATKGYYTNRLRLLAAAGLGASGVVAYRFLA